MTDEKAAYGAPRETVIEVALAAARDYEKRAKTTVSKGGHAPSLDAEAVAYAVVADLRLRGRVREVPEDEVHRVARDVLADYGDECCDDQANCACSMARLRRCFAPMTDDWMDGFMREWSKHENAPRTPCAECHFESSEGYPPSHAPGCPRSEPPDAK